MANASIDAKLLEALRSSTCFGLAYDGTVPECKQCDVKGSCKAKMEGGLGDSPIPTTRTISTPPEEKPKASTSAPKSKKSDSKPKASSKPKETPATPSNMPDFKPMKLPELEELAKERGVEWKDYGNDNITRMRLIMALKKSY